MNRQQREYRLDAKSISSVSADVRRFLTDNKVGQGICLRTGMIIEELLLAVRAECGESVGLKVTLSRRLGRPWIVLEYRAKRFNPVEDAERDSLSGTILTQLGIAPVWSHRTGVNRITFRLPFTGFRPEILLVGAFLLALLLGLCGGLIPEGARAFLTAYILTPASDIFTKLLSTLAPVLIFLSILTSVAGNSGGETANASRYIISRYIMLTAAISLGSAAALIPFFHFNTGKAAMGAASFSELYQMVLDVIPGNIVAPFYQGNMMQLIVLAVLLGSIIRGLDNRVGALSVTLRELHIVFLNAVEYICVALPIFIFTSMTTVFWTNGIGFFTALWKPIAVSIMLFVALSALFIGVVSVKYRAPARVLIRKCMPAFIVGLTTASSVAGYTKIIEGNRKLGIAERCNDLSCPLGVSMLSGMSAAMFLATMYHMAETHQTAVSPVWFLMAGVFCAIMGIATPPISGGVLITLSLLMSYLNIPTEGLALAGALALVLDFFATGVKLVAIHMEMVLQADHLKMLDVDTLRRDC